MNVVAETPDVQEVEHQQPEENQKLRPLHRIAAEQAKVLDQKQQHLVRQKPAEPADCMIDAGGFRPAAPHVPPVQRTVGGTIDAPGDPRGQHLEEQRVGDQQHQKHDALRPRAARRLQQPRAQPPTRQQPPLGEPQPAEHLLEPARCQQIAFPADRQRPGKQGQRNDDCRAKDDKDVNTLRRKPMHDAQTKNGPDPRRDVDERQHERQEHRIVVPRRPGHHPVGQKHRAAQQQEPPTAQEDGLLKLVQEDARRPGRNRQQESNFGRVEERSVQDDPGREKQHDHQRGEEHPKDGPDRLIVRFRMPDPRLEKPEPVGEQRKQRQPQQDAQPDNQHNAEPSGRQQLAQRTRRQPVSQPPERPRLVFRRQEVLHDRFGGKFGTHGSSLARSESVRVSASTS